MPNWPRTILPQQASWPADPMPLVSVGQSGKTQIRATTQVGRVWSETYGPLDRRQASVQSFLATVSNYARNGTIFQIDHRAQRTLIGAGSGSPLINGASQTGSSIITDGWTAATTLKAGDVLLLGALTVVYEVTADATADGSGNMTIAINPPIFVGGSPADNAAIVRNNVAGNVTYRARIASVQVPQAGPNEFYLGLSITFQECP